ncbi:MAG: glycosyltransferase family 4 protein [Pirellulaceae bacterium]
MNDSLSSSGPKLKGRLLMVGPKTGETVMGVSVAFDMLADYLKNAAQPVTEVNLTQSGRTQQAGTFTISRAIFTLFKVFEAWWKLIFADQLYLIISTSTVGFARDLLVIIGARVLRRCVVIHLHGGGYHKFYHESPRWRQRMIRWMLRRTHGIIVLGELLKNQFEFMNGAVPIHVVPNGLPGDDPIAQRFVAKTRPSNEAPWQILYLSNLMSSKGYYLLLEAVESMLSMGHKNFKVHFCGAFVRSAVETDSHVPCNNDAEFAELIRRRGLQDNMTYHGTVSGAAKVEMLQAAHVLVLPTTYPWEGQPLSIIEAMAFGTPVISTEHAGIPEEIEDEKTGWILKPNEINARGVRNRLEKLMSMTPAEYSSMSRDCHDLYLKRFTKARHLERLIEVINLSYSP